MLLSNFEKIIEKKNKNSKKTTKKTKKQKIS
jgi:hypothetical protein